jgi:hypothetical protein
MVLAQDATPETGSKIAPLVRNALDAFFMNFGMASEHDDIDDDAQHLVRKLGMELSIEPLNLFCASGKTARNVA